MSLSLKAYAPSSRQMISLQALDASGNPTPIIAYNPIAAQTLEVHAASGTYQPGFLGSYTAPIPIGASPATVQTAMQALSTIGLNNLLVEFSGFPYKLSFLNALAGVAQPLVTVNTTGLIATAPAISTVSGTSPMAIFDSTIGSGFALAGSGWTAVLGFGASWKIPATGTGLNTAKWTVSNLLTGTYNVYYSNSGLSGSTLSRTTPFRFSDNITPRQALPVNQQAIDPAVVFPGPDPAGFQLLATVFVTHPNDLNVLVTDEVQAGDINKFVCTNEIAVVPVNVLAPLYYDHSSVYVVETGTWSSFGSGWNNNEHFSSVPGNVLWKFAGLLSNSAYSFQMQWTEGGNRTTAAIYTVLDSDGVTVLGTITFNQQNNPSFYAGGTTLKDNLGTPFIFAPIGTFVVSGTYAYISLPVSNDGSNITMSEAAACVLSSVNGYHEAISSSVQNYSTGPLTIKLDGGSPVTLPDAIWGLSLNPAVPVMDFPFSSPTILPTNNVTIDVSNNCITTSAGVVPGVTNQAVINKTANGQTIMPDPPATQAGRTMGVGYNLMALGYSQPLYSNLVKNCVGLQYVGSAPVLPALTANGYPQARSLDAWQLLFGTGESPLNGQGYPLYPDGGTSTIVFGGNAGGYIGIVPFAGTTVSFIALNTGHATGNVLQVELKTDGSNTTLAPQFTITLNELYDVADDADTGRFSTTSGVWAQLFSSSYYNGSIHRSGAVGAIAIFSLGNVPASTQQVSLTWPANGANSANVTVIVKENNSPILTFTIDQTVAPAHFSTHDYNRTIVNFDPNNQQFTCGGGLITVELHGDGSGFCVADAVQISCVGSITSGSPFAPWTFLGLFDPTVGWPNQPKFHPMYVKAMKGATSARCMQLMGANGSSQVEYTDFPTADTLCYGAGARQNFYGITKVETWGNPNGFFKAGYGTALFTVDPLNNAPLNFVSGMPFTMPNAINPTYVSGGGGIDFSLYFSAMEHTNAMAANQFAMGTGANSGSGALNTLTPTSPAVNLGFGTTSFIAIPPLDYFEFCDLIGAEPWLNTTAIASQTCIERLADDYMSVYTAGSSKIRYEIGNEPWNSQYGYPYYQYYVGLQNTLSLPDSQTGYAMVASQRHTWFYNRLQTQGRGNELIRVYNAQFGDSSTAGSIFTYLNNHSLPIDEICTAVYVTPFPSVQPGLDTIYAGLTAAQLSDILDAWIGLGNFFQPTIDNFKRIVNQQTIDSGRPCGLSGYEGGIASMEIGGSTCLIREKQALAGIMWPQIYYVTRAYLGVLQAHGNFTQFCIYSLDQPPVDDGGGCTSATYGKNLWYTFQPGIGDGSDGLHDNRPDLLGSPPNGPNWLLDVTPGAAAIDWWNGIKTTAASIWQYLRQARTK